MILSGMLNSYSLLKSTLYQHPSLSIYIPLTIYFSLSMFFITDFADITDTSCSVDMPPNITTTFFILSPYFNFFDISLYISLNFIELDALSNIAESPIITFSKNLIASLLLSTLLTFSSGIPKIRAPSAIFLE